MVERTLGLQKANEELAKISVTDELTGLNNRRFLSNNLKSDIELVIRRNHNKRLTSVNDEDNESDLIFFLIDLDHFKQVNDEYGHTAGDAVLMQIKSILMQVLGKQTILLDGEEKNF